MTKKNKRKRSTSHLKNEKESWEKPHSLDCDPILAQKQLKLLDELGKRLFLCFDEKGVDETKYQHWFITDKCWYIEFGDEGHSSNLSVHGNAKLPNYCIVKEFDLTQEVKERISEVLGTTNYSLVLRNSEHLARYIHCGRWFSLQTSGKGNLKKQFHRLMSENTTKLLNTFPSELEKIISTKETTELYSNGSQNRIVFEKQHSLLSDEDNSSYNIVFIGPTGCGKSSLINLLFNENVNESRAGASSVTRDVSFLQGSAELRETNEGESIKIIQPKINIIDTIGLCDSVMNEEEVFSLIKEKLETNLFHIDRVVIVCSGRIELYHQEAMKNFMKWLKYKEYKRNFTFIYNKCDMIEEEKRLENLMDACGMLGIDATNNIKNENIRPTELAFTSGMPPNSKFEDIKDNLLRLQESVLVPTYEENNGFNHPEDGTVQRIPINRDQCTIL